MNPSDPAAEIRELSDRLLDGSFTAEDRARLESLVLGDPSLRRLYVELMHQHATLRQNASRIGNVTPTELLRTLPEAGPANVIRGPFIIRRWMKAAAAVAIGAAAWWLVPRPPAATFATLVETNGARWENSALPTAPGSRLAAGRLRLADGVARIVFQSGAEVSLEGPAELELTGPNACFLHTGALTAHVPDPAKGFIVGTANARLVDHGTDFGISTDATGRAQVQVLQGEVELQHGSNGEKLRLHTRESAAVTADRFRPGDRNESEPDRFAFLRDAQPPTLAITTAGGGGDAAYVVSPHSPIHHSDTLLLVKNAPSAPYRRKAFLRFDLAPLRARNVASATLTLNFEPTGFGYASLTGECVFAVYGVTDDAQDDWSAESLTWENAPAFSPDGGSVDPAHATMLGTFTMPRNVVSGAFSISGEKLAEFLNRDANRRATLIVVRETSLPRSSSAVHGFAGNHHPALAPPTLRLTLAP